MHRTFTNNDNFTYIKAIHKQNYSLTKSLRLSNTSITPCPIKPTENIIPKDLNLQKIFSTMLNSSQQLSELYSSYITKNSFSHYSLNTNYKNLTRKVILRQLREFFLYYNIEYKIYFKTIFLFDIISIENENKKFLESMEEIALGALILAIKFNYDENKMFSMKKFLQIFVDKNYTLLEIIDIERRAIKTINYFLNFTTPMCFLEFFLINGIIYNVDYLNEAEYAKIYFEIENVLEKIMEESNIYLKYNFFYLACSVVSYCRNIFNLDKWPKMLKKVFSIDFYFFQTEYNYFFNRKDINNENNNYNSNYNKTYSQRTYNSNSNNKKDIIINGNNNVVLLDLKNLNLNNTSKNKRNRNYIYNSYKRNYNKTIDYYNNIINININNVSFNNIYNNNTINEAQNNSKEKYALNTDRKAKRFHYKIENSYIIYNNNNSKKLNKSLFNNRVNKNVTIKETNNENDEMFKNNYNLSSNLAEIKEVKDISTEQNTYSSPPKRKRRHYYIIKNENKNKIKENEKNEENKQNSEKKDKNEENKDKHIEENKNVEINNDKNKNKTTSSQIRKIFTYSYYNSLKNLIESNNENNNIIKYNNKKYNKNEENKEINNNYKNKNINLKYIGENEQKSNYRYNKTIENIDEKNDKLEKSINNNNEKSNSPEKKPNILFNSKHSIYEYYKKDKKNLENKSIIQNRYNNIKLTKLEKSNPNIEQSDKNTLSIGKYGSSRIRKFRNFNKNMQNNLNKIDEIKENSNNEKKIILIKNKEANLSRNKKKHRGENKIKYNNLIKYKLSKCDSINKRNNIRNINGGYN